MLDTVETWLQRLGGVRLAAGGHALVLDFEALENLAELVAAAQREAAARLLESMSGPLTPQRCAAAVRGMRAPH